MFKVYRSIISLRRRTVSSLVGALLLVAVSAAGYSSSSTLRDCPVTVSGPDFTVEGQQINFQASPTNYQSYHWDVSAGEISGPIDTPSITVVNVAAGSSCKATVTIRNGTCQSSSFHITSVFGPPVCPTFTVACPDSVEEGALITFTTNLTGGNPNTSPTFNWSISAGEITQGQGTATITVNTTGLGGQSVTATVEIGGINPDCSRTASCTTAITVRPKARKIDEFGRISLGAERIRLESYAQQLQNEPNAQGYIFVYGNEHSVSVRRRVKRIKDYLVRSLHVETARLIAEHGQLRQQLSVELWIVPSGAAPPSVNRAPW